jgi:hypothetical protein
MSFVRVVSFWKLIASEGAEAQTYSFLKTFEGKRTAAMCSCAVCFGRSSMDNGYEKRK